MGDSFEESLGSVAGLHVRAMRNDTAVLVAFRREATSLSEISIWVTDGCKFCYKASLGEKEFTEIRNKMRIKISWSSFFTNLAKAILTGVSFAAVSDDEDDESSITLQCAVSFGKGVATIYEFQLPAADVRHALPLLMFDLVDSLSDLQRQLKRKEEELAARPLPEVAHFDEPAAPALEAAPAAKKAKKVAATIALTKKSKGAKIK